MKIQWMWNGIKVDGKLHRVHYSKAVLIGDSQESITLYARGYSDHLPKEIGLNVENDSDSMTDYFETDSARIRQDSKFWKEALSAYEKQQEHRNQIMLKRSNKYGFKFEKVA